MRKFRHCRKKDSICLNCAEFIPSRKSFNSLLVTSAEVPNFFFIINFLYTSRDKFKGCIHINSFIRIKISLNKFIEEGYFISMKRSSPSLIVFSCFLSFLNFNIINTNSNLYLGHSIIRTNQINFNRFSNRFCSNI